MGDGIIDGRGGETMLGATGSSTTWWQLADQARAGGTQNNPRLLVLSGCDNFTLYRITLRNSPNFHASYNGGNGFTVWGVKVYSPKNARNTDGIDPGNSTNVTIAYSWLDTGDIDGDQGGPVADHHMTVATITFIPATECRLKRNQWRRQRNPRLDLSIDGADNGIRIKSTPRAAASCTIGYEDVCMKYQTPSIWMRITQRQSVRAGANTGFSGHHAAQRSHQG
jgi:polygalacturonase